ncbi:MAG: hypothetical protein VX317_10330, partial [Verrucomicrobiota bacterium]|nr:hypothetical protein [Verrucomicrobiota bacterium]
TFFHAGGVGLIGMGLLGWFADRSPKAPKWVQAPAANIPGMAPPTGVPGSQPPAPTGDPPPLPPGPGPGAGEEKEGE